ncbi:PLP-dependent aminotransferase family protein [Leucobacter albus]|uniref:PLP-dependent aminotransferase family protein n=1 Tax=Leucobacter albus TaxID=272210 RepID=A0ABW3TP09_9MICO
MNDDSSSRIVTGLLDWISRAPAGARLPPTRALVAEYQASPVTVQKALRTLSARGAIETRPGVGAFVRAVRTARPLDFAWQTEALRSPQHRLSPAPATMRASANTSIALHAGYPDRELLPERLIRQALGRAGRSEAAVTRAPAAGLPELQAWFAQELAAATPLGVTPVAASDVIVLPGSQSGLSSTFRALVSAGQPLLVESPTYWGAILAAEQAGVTLVPVSSGPQGPDPGALARAFAETGARAFYAQPNYANPTGAQWSPDRAAQILAVVREYGTFLIEDDWAHDFGISTEPVPLAASDDAGHVVYLRSLTKSVSPAIRIAGVIARGPARERILADRRASAMYVSGILQAAALDVVTQPGWASHLRGLKQQLRARRDLLAESLAEFAPTAHLTGLPHGGLNLWAQLGDGVDVHTLVRACEDEGVLVAAGHEWFPAEPSGAFVRLNYSGPNPGAFPEAARVIGGVLARLGS